MTNAVLMVRTRTRCIVVHLRWLELVYTFVPKNGVLQTCFFATAPASKSTRSSVFLQKRTNLLSEALREKLGKKNTGKNTKITNGLLFGGSVDIQYHTSLYLPAEGFR